MSTPFDHDANQTAVARPSEWTGFYQRPLPMPWGEAEFYEMLVRRMTEASCKRAERARTRAELRPIEVARRLSRLQPSA